MTKLTCEGTRSRVTLRDNCGSRWWTGGGWEPWYQFSHCHEDNGWVSFLWVAVSPSKWRHWTWKRLTSQLVSIPNNFRVRCLKFLNPCPELKRYRKQICSPLSHSLPVSIDVDNSYIYTCNLNLNTESEIVRVGMNFGNHLMNNATLSP